MSDPKNDGEDVKTEILKELSDFTLAAIRQAKTLLTTDPPAAQTLISTARNAEAMRHELTKPR